MAEIKIPTEINSTEALQAAVATAQEIKAALAIAEAGKDAATSPLKARLVEIETRHKAITAQLRTGLETIQNLIGDYDAHLMQFALEGGRARAETEQLDQDEIAQVLVWDKHLPDVKGVTCRRRIRVAVDDAEVVPREYWGESLWTIDLKAVERVAKRVRSTGKVINIPGISCTIEKSFSVRAGKGK